MMWINPVEIKSSSSSRKYTVSELSVDGVPTGTYGCSCPGWKSYGKCKHLAEMGLPSARDYNRPAPKGEGTSDNSAYSHYDPAREGYGSSSQWRGLVDSLKGEEKMVATDTQWDEIFRLVEERSLTPRDIKILDNWITENSTSYTPTGIIDWLNRMPLRKEEDVSRN